MENANSRLLVYPTPAKEMVRVALLGAAIGAATALLAQLVSSLATPLFCGSQSFGFCAQGGSIAFSLVFIAFSMIAVALLSAWQSYQPLLNVVGPFAALWGIDVFLQPVAQSNFALYVAICSGLLLLCYVLFYAVLRLRSFMLSVVIMIIVTLVIQLQL